MIYKFIIVIFLFSSCSSNYNSKNFKEPYNSKGLAYIYNDKDFFNKIIKKKMNNNLPQIAHYKLKPGTLIKLINPKTNDSIILKNNYRFQYPDFYKILITNVVANQINLDQDSPLIEVLEIKKNKSFIAEKTKIYSEEKKIHSNAPVEQVKIDNISKYKKNVREVPINKFFIIIAQFYSNKSAILLKKRITKELTNFDSKKLNINIKKSNKITLLSGPYSSINLLKNDYILLKEFGFEELDISINE